MKPHFVHDCKNCMYLGYWLHPNAEGPEFGFDLYYCKWGNNKGSTILARYGDDPGFYQYSRTSLYSYESQYDIAELREAYNRARNLKEFIE